VPGCNNPGLEDTALTADPPFERDGLDVLTSEGGALARLLQHETKTPLNAIRGFTELLLGGAAGPLGAEALGLVREIARAARSLEHALQLLHELAALESSVTAPPAEPVDIGAILVALGFSFGQDRHAPVVLPCVLGEAASWHRAMAACRAYLLGLAAEGPLRADAADDASRGLELLLSRADMKTGDGTGLLAIELARRIAARQGGRLGLWHGNRIVITWPQDRVVHHTPADGYGQG
jgi:hypothetical protein